MREQAIKEHMEMLEILREEYREAAKRLKMAIADKVPGWEIKAIKNQVDSIVVDGKAVRKGLEDLGINL